MKENAYLILLAIWAGWNLITFLIMGIDKLLARMKKWRISEAFLIGIAIFMGAVGSLLGMKVFHHKTRKKKFKIGLPLALIFNIAVGAGLIYLIYL